MNVNTEKLPLVPVSRKRATAVLAIGGYVNTGILIVQGLLMVPLYLHFVGAPLYGLWMASGGILGMLGVLNFGVSNMLVQRIANAYGRQDFLKTADYFINGIFVYLAIVLIFMSAGLLVSFFFSELLKVSGGESVMLRGCFQLAVVAAGLGILNECLRSFAQALLRPIFSMVTIALSRIVGIAVIISLLFRDAGLWAIPVGMLFAEILILFFGLIQTVSLFRGLRVKISIDSTIIKEYFQLGGAMFIARLGSALSRESAPLLITYFLRPELTTAYMVTRRAADMVSQLLAVIYGAAHSAFSHLVGHGDKEKTSEVATRLLIMIFVFGLVGFVTYVTMNHSFVTLWVGEAFALNQEIILMIGIAFFASSLRNMVWQVLNGFGDYQYSSRVILFEGVGKILLSAVLLGFLGMPGEPLALVVTSIIAMIAMCVKLQRHVELKISNKEMVNALVITLVLFVFAELGARMINPSSWVVFVLFLGGVASVSSVVIVLSGWTKFRGLIKVRW
ncbi:lipopolysaccharide biosynthesis protein [Thiovibrio frasassiensis]|uniref:Oligosaccharide flippase family protein n=1 Tax=Thiovibrio frasassiensis TaxID=2984131 RepID=A0A9X4RM69_9BACT|nr:oligosaccharide flippase family protein [Thiovibrio frasassiensis]MDG4476030.1 oligosaccharide flippase family protein [Thiovibrio frasassiensis]